MPYRWLLLTGSFAALTVLSSAQDESFLKKAPNPGEARVRANEMRDGRRQVLKGNEEASNKKDLLKMAQALMYPVTEATYYQPPEPSAKNPTELRPVAAEFTFQSKLDDLDKYVLKPGYNTKLNFDQYDFLAEIGAAYDATLKELFALNAPVHVKVNTARMLALVARSGAPAHAKMITELIANPDTPPELLTYALQAARNLLEAYDPRLAGGLNFGNHTIKDAELVKLIQALEAVINRQKPYGVIAPAKAPPAAVGIVKEELKKEAKPAVKKDLPGKTGGKLDAALAPAPFDDEQAAVIRFLRRQAIRALAQVRVPTVVDAKSNTSARPLFTLCRIAVNDGPFAPALGPEEYADAVLGLMSLHSIRNVDVDVVANCMAQGAYNFANRKGASSTTIPWKLYGVKFHAGVVDLQRVIGVTASMQTAGAKLGPLLSLLSTKIAAPLEALSKTNPSVTGLGLEDLQTWLNGRTLKDMVPYTDVSGVEKNRLTLKPVPAN